MNSSSSSWYSWKQEEVWTITWHDFFLLLFLLVFCGAQVVYVHVQIDTVDQ